ncbi:MAG: OmpA family protein, partial [Saprospiraceae bacterium]
AWGRPRLLGNQVNMEDHNSSTPFVTMDIAGNDVLYYASDRPGTLGGMDIWAVTRNIDGSLANLVNLGDGINTIGDEVSPYIDDADGYADPRPRLYFSSNGRVGYGGLDVFMAYKNNVNFTDWSKPENAGRLLNSPADDMGFVLTPNKEKGYFVSNRVGGYSIAGRTCCDDIFVAQLEAPELEKIIVANLGGLIYDENNAIKAGVDLLLYDVTDGKELKGGSTTGLRGYGYNFLDLEKDYLLEMRLPGYEFQEYRFSTKNLKDSKTFRKDFYLVKIAPVVCSTELKIFGDSGKSSKSPLSNTNLKVYRTDGGKTLFKELTTNNKGVANVDLPKGGSFSITGSKDGYLTSTSVVSTKGASKGCNKSLVLSLKEKRKDISFNLDNILYNYNSDKLRDESIPNMEVLYGLLSENPSIIIEISSHTDSKGSESYNQKLSQGRAQSVVTWL